jgi:hypothetical protein
MKIRAVKNGCLFLSTGDALIVRQGDELELSSSGAGLVESGLFEFIGGPDQAGSPPLPAGQREKNHHRDRRERRAEDILS